MELLGICEEIFFWVSVLSEVADGLIILVVVWRIFYFPFLEVDFSAGSFEAGHLLHILLETFECLDGFDVEANARVVALAAVVGVDAHHESLAVDDAEDSTATDSTICGHCVVYDVLPLD